MQVTADRPQNCVQPAKTRLMRNDRHAMVNFEHSEYTVHEKDVSSVSDRSGSKEKLQVLPNMGLKTYTV